MPAFPKTEVAQLLNRHRAGARRPVLARSPDEQGKASNLLEVFVPGALPNPLNGPVGIWQTRARLRADWLERTAQHLFVAVHERYGAAGLARLPAPGMPKRITFTLYVGRLRDDDSLPGSCKPLRDALAPRFIDSDGPASGHLFIYRQERQPGVRGVGIAIENLPAPGGPACTA